MGLAANVKTTYLRQEKTVRRIGTNADWGGEDFNIVTITGGPVRVTDIWGHVTTACTGATLVPLLEFNPAGEGATTVIAAIAAGAIWPENTILAWDGSFNGALSPTRGIGHAQATEDEGFQGAYMIFVPGTILVVNATTDATAVIDWYISWKPLTLIAKLRVV